MASGFVLDKEARKNYLHLPRTLFFLTVFFLPVCGILGILLYPYIEGSAAAYLFGALIVLPFISLPVVGGYLGYACGRSKTQRLTIKHNGYVTYYVHSGGENYDDDKFYVIRRVYAVKVSSRVIKVWFESKLFPLQIPRTFTNDEQIIAQLKTLQSKTRELPPIIPLEILKYIIGFIKLPFLIIMSIIRDINSIKVEGTLNGFEEKEERHYPRFSFTTQNGQFIEKTDYSSPIEELLKDAEVERMLRKKYPKKITIRYSKNDPENFSGLFL